MGSAKKEKGPPPRVGPGSRFESVPKNVSRHMQRLSNMIVIDFDTVNLKVNRIIIYTVSIIHIYLKVYAIYNVIFNYTLNFNFSFLL